MSKKKFGIVIQEVIKDPDLSLKAKGLYSLLCCYANKERECWPKIDTLAEFSGVSRRTIERSLKELENKNYIKRNRGFYKIV